MYLCIRQQLKHLSKEEYQVLRELCHVAKNLYNESLYQIRQHFFATGKYLSYSENYHCLKQSENYRLLNSNMAQQIMKEADGAFKSFFALRKKVKAGEYTSKSAQLPKYLPKDGFMTLVIGFVRLQDDKLVLPYSRAYGKEHPTVSIKLPPNLKGKHVKEIRIKPQAHARFFEVQYTYEVEEDQHLLNNNKALAVDIGVNNLAACVTDTGKTFLIDGRKLKSKNQWYNKQLARLQSIKDKQGIKDHTKRMELLVRKRNNQVRDYMSKAASQIVQYCIQNQIGNLIVGYNDDFQRNSNLGKRGNQIFVNIPYGYFINKLEYLCRLHGINFVLQEESYTSKASFFDQDEMPVY